MARNSVKLINAALDEIVVQGGNQIVLRGVLDNDSLDLLQVGEYQREVLPQSKIMDLVNAMKTGSVPDIELGMRGGDYRDIEGAFYLQDPVFIIDGLQRVTAGKHMLRLLGEGDCRPPRLGATIYFNTSEIWERDRFRILNVQRSRLSANVLLRNQRHESAAIEAMYNLATTDKLFVMHNRIAWNQAQSRSELISAQTFLGVVCALHSHLGPTRSANTNERLKGIEKVMKVTGRNIFRDNIRMFYDVIDQAWGIKAVTFKVGAAYLRHGFMVPLAKMFSNHENFWRENRFFVDADLVRKLRLFALSDPNIRDLCSSGGQSGRILYRLLVDHINSGRRSGRLRERMPFEDVDVSETAHRDAPAPVTAPSVAPVAAMPAV